MPPQLGGRQTPLPQACCPEALSRALRCALTEPLHPPLGQTAARGGLLLLEAAWTGASRLLRSSRSGRCDPLHSRAGHSRGGRWPCCADALRQVHDNGSAQQLPLLSCLSLQGKWLPTAAGGEPPAGHRPAPAPTVSHTLDVTQWPPSATSPAAGGRRGPRMLPAWLQHARPGRRLRGSWVWPRLLVLLARRLTGPALGHGSGPLTITDINQ